MTKKFVSIFSAVVLSIVSSLAVTGTTEAFGSYNSGATVVTGSAILPVLGSWTSFSGVATITNNGITFKGYNGFSSITLEADGKVTTGVTFLKFTGIVTQGGPFLGGTMTPIAIGMFIMWPGGNNIVIIAPPFWP